MFLNSISGGIKDLQIENKKRKNSSRAGRGTSSHRTESEVDSHDSSSISTLDQAVKQWMVAAAKGKFEFSRGLHQKFRVGSGHWTVMSGKGSGEKEMDCNLHIGDVQFTRNIKFWV